MASDYTTIESGLPKLENKFYGIKPPGLWLVKEDKPNRIS
jgi:hypothetical protein